MHLKIEAIIALRYLQARKTEAMISVTAWLALLGIMLGVAALVVVISVMNGYRAELTSKLKGCNSDITVTSRDKILGYTKLCENISALKGIESVFPLIEEQSLVTTSHTSRGIIVKAVSNLSSYPLLTENPFNPRTIERANGILLGYNLAIALKVRPGETVRLLSPEFTDTIIGRIPNAKDFYVEGIFKSGLTDYDAVYALVPLKIGQTFFNLDAAVNKLEVFTKDGTDVNLMSLEVARAIGHKYTVQNWQTANKFLLHALKTERSVMFIILTFIIIVATFNIISSLTMLVLCKTREIAILRTIGFTQASIMRIFLMCGFIIGGLGTTLGVALGLLFAYYINEIKNFLSKITGTDLFNPIVYYLDTLPSKVDAQDVIKIAIIAAIMTVLATLYPSYKASRIQPAQGLKND
jgi:lipoprotein-releasing system permease protein